MVEEADLELLNEFTAQIYSRMPSIEDNQAGSSTIRATPLVDITAPLIECAKLEYGMRLDASKLKVLGKMDSVLIGGSVKARAAVKIVERAIRSGKLKRGQPIFEATSGNFGIALGLLTGLGFKVVVLVSRRIKDGVVKALESSGVGVINLDVDICPAPAFGINSDAATAKSLAENLVSQLKAIGFDDSPFESARGEIENLLMRQDVINLAKVLARIYDGFCPEQYDNEVNVLTHEELTGPEIDAQLRSLGEKVSDFRFVCTFGTGGTSTGIGRYLLKKYGRKQVHVIFPLSNQDVAGIRSKEKATGLKFYQPSIYSGEHEVDFNMAKRLLRFFVAKGYDIGESSALALWGVVNLANFGIGDRFIVMLADDSSKYLDETGGLESLQRINISLDEASKAGTEFSEIIWTHPSYVPKPEVLNLIASSLGVSQSKVKVLHPAEVREILYSGELDHSTFKEDEIKKGKMLLVCIGGGNSLRMAELLTKKGAKAFSLEGGLVSISNSRGVDPRVLLNLP